MWRFLLKRSLDNTHNFFLILVLPKYVTLNPTYCRVFLEYRAQKSKKIKLEIDFKYEIIKYLVCRKFKI